MTGLPCHFVQFVQWIWENKGLCGLFAQELATDNQPAQAQVGSAESGERYKQMSSAFDLSRVGGTHDEPPARQADSSGRRFSGAQISKGDRTSMITSTGARAHVSSSQGLFTFERAGANRDMLQQRSL